MRVVTEQWPGPFGYCAHPVFPILLATVVRAVWLESGDDTGDL
jgi:hypothetical protein